MTSNNPPYSELQLTKDQHSLLLETCDANLSIGLNILKAVQEGTMSRDAAEKTIALMEGYKGIRKKLQSARPDHNV